MKFYENLDPVERHKLVLRAVAASSYFESMDASVMACLDNIAAIERWDKAALLDILRNTDEKTVKGILGDVEVLDTMRLAQESGLIIQSAAEFLKSMANR